VLEATVLTWATTAYGRRGLRTRHIADVPGYGSGFNAVVMMATSSGVCLQRYGHIDSSGSGAIIGLALMMILDTALG
jgi:hypothetical protein